MSLFRRFRRDKENEPTAESSAPEDEVAPATEEANPEPAPVTETPTSPAPETAAPEEPTPPRIPPPLPDRPTPPPAPVVPPAVDSRTKCFVCGTPLVGKMCPTCRMTWVE